MDIQVEKAARVAKIPLFSLDSDSNMALATAIQSLLGFNSSTPSNSARQQAIAVQIQALSSKKTTPAESAALNEVRFAIEDIVVLRKQPVELMPQIPHILEMQVHHSLSITSPYPTFARYLSDSFRSR